MVDAVLSFAVKKLGEFITQKLAVQSEVRSNAEWLQWELAFMESFLKDAEKMQGSDYRVSQWVSDIQNISDDIISVLEDFMLKIGDEDINCLHRIRFYTCICSKEANVFAIGKEIESLKARVMEISRRRKAYGISNITNHVGETSSSTVKSLRRSTSFMDGDQVFVGLEDIKLSLLDELLKDDLHRCMVSIYGAGGSGKTSLARSIYDSTEVVSSFPCRAWTYVSQEYTISEVLRRVTKSLKKKYSTEEIMVLDRMTEEDLERYLRQLLEDRKYLVVIDDVWDINVWGSLKRAFPDDNNRSRVIVTTRNKDVATQMGERISAHQIRLLNPKESWKLFLEKLSQGDGESANWCSPAMLDVGQEMVMKCDGLPLAIVVLGGLLAHKKSLHEWQTVRERFWNHLIRGSLEISNLLILSYDDLSSELKLCFLYVGVYPEDYEFGASRLKQCWIAEDFIKQGVDGEEMEDIAQAYLNELTDRNLIQVSTMRWGEIEYCRIHDLVRNLAVKKATEVEFFDIYNPVTTRPHLHHPVRRQVVHSQIQRYVATQHYSKNTSLQSLLMYNTDMEQIESGKLVITLKRFSRLSVLYLDISVIPQKLMKVAGSLKQLKLLVLITPTTTTIYLPPTIGNLIQLQKICISGGGSCNLPGKISKLKNLRHLVCPRGVEGNTAEIGTLSNLQTLNSIRYEHWIVIVTENLINLRELRINDIKRQNGKDYSLESISMIKSLHTLRLHCTDKETGFPPLDFMSSLHKLHKLSLNGELRVVPSIETWPKSIRTLCLAGSKFEEDPIPTLARFPNLIRLDLVATHKPGNISFPPQSFPQLEQLGLCLFSELKRLGLEEGALPIIKSLYVIECQKLDDNKMPERLRSILLRRPGGEGLFDEMYAAYLNFF